MSPNHRSQRRLPTAARTVVSLLDRLPHGHLSLVWPDGQVQAFGAHNAELHASLLVHDLALFAAVLKSGDIGFAQAFIEGQWSTPDLMALLRLLAANRAALERAIYGHWLGAVGYRLRHFFNRNTRSNSRRNIHAHYDLGNAFYGLWLDESMNYSSGLFEGEQERSLLQAQQAKMSRALRLANVRAGSRLLEIGCGWGAVAELAASKHAAHVTGVTLSQEQLTFAKARLQRAGLAAQTELRLQDYRDIEAEPFDAIISIEMIEAVGQAYWPAYFGTLKRLLKPGGRACVQSIVIRDDLFERYLKGTDFIQQYIFPGGCLPSRGELHRQAAAAGLVVVDEQCFGLDYGRTLRLWREAFLARRNEMQALGFDTPFLRTWEFYLAYCEAGFAVGNVDLVQFTMERR